MTSLDSCATQRGPQPSRFASLDQALLELIAAGNDRFSALMNTYTGKLEREAAQPARPGKEIEVFRIIDRHLQALRKAGKISYVHGCWGLLAK